MDKTKCILFTVFIAVVVFCHSGAPGIKSCCSSRNQYHYPWKLISSAIPFCPPLGDAIRCYTCEQSPVVCRTNVTCTHEEDVCLQIRFLHLRTYSCWKSSRCTRKEVADEFNADSFRFLCCYKDLCNKSPSFLAASAAAFSISVVTVLWMVYQ